MSCHSLTPSPVPVGSAGLLICKQCCDYNFLSPAQARLEIFSFGQNYIRGEFQCEYIIMYNSVERHLTSAVVSILSQSQNILSKTSLVVFRRRQIMFSGPANDISSGKQWVIMKIATRTEWGAMGALRGMRSILLTVKLKSSASSDCQRGRAAGYSNIL